MADVSKEEFAADLFADIELPNINIFILLLEQHYVHTGQ
jgi:hypothetical protein